MCAHGRHYIFVQIHHSYVGIYTVLVGRVVYWGPANNETYPENSRKQFPIVFLTLQTNI